MRNGNKISSKNLFFSDSDEEVKLIQLRNPWGDDHEWNQGWSDIDLKSWDSVRPDEKAKYFVGNVSKHALRKSLKAQTRIQYLDHKLGFLDLMKLFAEAKDGKFWMSWADFLNEFESLSICMLPNAE